MKAANGINLFVKPGYLTTTSRIFQRFLSTETDELHNVLIRSRSLKRLSGQNSHAQEEENRELDLEIARKVCGIEYHPRILSRGRMSLIVELKSSDEAKLLLENRQVEIDDNIFFIVPEPTAEEYEEIHKERCLEFVIIQGIPELASGNKKEQKKNSLKYVGTILSHLGSEIQVRSVRLMGTKMVEKTRWVKVGFHSQDDAQSLLDDGNTNKVKIEEHTFHINPFQVERKIRAYKIECDA